MKLSWMTEKEVEYVSNNECAKALNLVDTLNTSALEAEKLNKFHIEVETKGTTAYDVAMAEIARQIVKKEGYNVDYFVNKDIDKIEWIVSWKVKI